MVTGGCAVPKMLQEPFEQGVYERKDLVIPVEELKRMKKTPSTWFRPQMEGSAYNPHDRNEKSWDAAGRHEKPTEEELTERWVNDR